LKFWDVVPNTTKPSGLANVVPCVVRPIVYIPTLNLPLQHVNHVLFWMAKTGNLFGTEVFSFPFSFTLSHHYYVCLERLNLVVKMETGGGSPLEPPKGL